MRILGPKMDTLLSSSMRQALFKREKPRLELKSTATFLSIKHWAGTKIGKVIKGLTAKCVPAGTKNSLSEDFLLAKHTSHKHPHHDEPFSPLAAWFLMEEHTSPPGASLEGAGQGHHQRD